MFPLLIRYSRYTKTKHGIILTQDYEFIDNLICFKSLRYFQLRKKIKNIQKLH